MGLVTCGPLPHSKDAEKVLIKKKTTLVNFTHSIHLNSSVAAPIPNLK